MVTSVSISPTEIVRPEGQGGVTYFVYTVNRSGDLAGPTVVDYSVLGSGADAASAADFQGGALPSGKVWFGGGESVKQIWVPVVGDTAAEATEAFTVTLSNPSGAVIATAAASGTIKNDDGEGPPPVDPGTAPTLSIQSDWVAQPEGDAGATAFTFTVTRTGDLSATTTANWSVLGGGPAQGLPDGAAAAADFTGGALPSGSVSFAPGQSSATVQVNVAGDAAPEPNDVFRVVLSDLVGATGGGSTSGIIQNDDGGALSLTRVSSGAQAEGDSGTTAFVFTATRSGGADGAASVEWRVEPGGAADSADFAGAALPSGVVNFADGQTSAQVSVLVAGDVAVEANETFTVTLSNPVNAYVAFGAGTSGGTIQNDDAAAPPSGNAVNSGPGAEYFGATAANDIFAYDAPADGADVVFNYDASGSDSLQFKLGSGLSLGNQSGPGPATLVSVNGPGASIAGADVVVWNHPWQKLASAAQVDSMLSAQAGTFDGGVLVVAHNAGQKLAVYYDADANSAGGVTQLVSLDNLTSTSSLGAGDFAFV